MNHNVGHPLSDGHQHESDFKDRIESLGSRVLRWMPQLPLGNTLSTRIETPWRNFLDFTIAREIGDRAHAALVECKSKDSGFIDDRSLDAAIRYERTEGLPVFIVAGP